MEFWMVLALLSWSSVYSGEAVDCYTCNVDFRNEPYEANNSCLFPRDTKGKTTCSGESKYCQGVITRVNGVFVQLQRTCEVICEEFCQEKGFGIEFSECRFCCNDSIKNNAECGFQGYKSDAYLTQPFFGWFSIYIALCVVCDFINFEGGKFRQNSAKFSDYSQDKRKFSRFEECRFLPEIN